MAELVILMLGVLALGAIFGSFINALVFRFHTGRGMGGRSRCMSCNHTLAAHDLVPVFSYLSLGGRCRYCGASISWQYPLVELAAALLGLGVLWHAILLPPYAGSLPPELLLAHLNLLAFVLWFATWMVVLFIVVYDLRHMIIPWSASLSLLALIVLTTALLGGWGVWAWAAGPLLALPLFLLSFVSAGRWMGWADSLFELSLGLLLGLSAGATAIFIAVWSGALVGLALMAHERLTPKRLMRGVPSGFTMHSEIPFAPLLALGAAVAFFAHVDFFATFSLLFR